MCDLLIRTINDPAIFWSAVQALATLIAVVIIYIEIRRSKREMTIYKFEGFKYAMDILASKDFVDSVKAFRYLMDAGDTGDWDIKIPVTVHNILKSLDIIAVLIEQNYLDQDFFLRHEGLRLANIDQRLILLETGNRTPKCEYESGLYPKGRDLLRRAEDWKEKHGV